MAANNLYQPNQRRTLIPSNQTQLPQPADYMELLSAECFESDPPPLFTSQGNPTSSGQAQAPVKPHTASEINPDTLLPPSFFVDWHKVSPLITVPELQQYLKLLGSFHAYLQHVFPATKDTTTASDDSRFIPVFEKAATMFDTWATEALARNAGRGWTIRDPSDLPSIEVLMAWHAYLTNPRWYFEDSARLGKLCPFPLELVAEFIDEDTLDYMAPSPAPELPVKQIPDITAVVQQTPLRLCVTKFARDLIAVAKGDMRFLAGAGLSPSTGGWVGEDGTKISRAFIAALLGNPTAIFACSDPVEEIGNRLQWKIDNAFSPRILKDVRARCQQGMNIEHSQLDARIQRMQIAYSVPGPMSVDLVKEMAKQARFLTKMKKLGWLQPSRFDGNTGKSSLLQKCAIRYHAFLDCLSAMQADLACPTLDIELAWQLHQIHSDRYVNDCSKLFKGSIPDQSGTPNIDAALHAAYSTTAKTWQRLHRLPYSTCGCYGTYEIEEMAPTPTSFKDKLKAKMTGKAAQEMGPAWKNFVTQVSINEREASHPSSLEFHHR
ncbi:hypothetical protein QFC22_001715 [Naganishia vaughanmartiniae]|uniref:Uncharacterized protein n=1 Tax=Naganishia vaughanmartiniae TaxID=1424756 RepID=A0ACC2XFX9_9TREE|nr:hypothetical protein QFC22_001715 [Naganishia vaughanmartiniae]